MTEVWFRNPHLYIRELVELGESRIAWDYGTITKKRINPAKHASLFYGKSVDYRILLVGDQGTAELGPGDTMDKPKAVYPTWQYGDSDVLLEEIVSQPVGEDKEMCFDTSIPREVRPTYGQEHRVVIIRPPDMRSGPGRALVRYLKELQEDYPNCIIHLHGLYGYATAFGMGLGAADIDPRVAAAHGRIALPSGKEVKFERTKTNSQWVTHLGFTPGDLEVPRNRCLFNIKSAVWASENWDKLSKFTVRKTVVDTTSSDKDYKAPTTSSIFSAYMKAKPGDKMICDDCSLALTCKYYRKGSVCAVPGSEASNLARYFQTRDSGMILDGLGHLLAANTRRLEKGLGDEELDGELSPEVSKIMSQVFDQGTKLAKLLDPSLRGGANVQVNVAGGSAQITSGSPKQMIATVIRELESQGIAREDITNDMIEGVLSSMAKSGGNQRAIEGSVISTEDRDV